MKNHKFFFIIFFLLFSILGCGVTNTFFMSDKNSFTETFSDQEFFNKNWIDNSWKSPDSYFLENKKLKITTRPKTKDRVKIRSKRTFTTGSYTWRIFVPEFILYEQISIGAFLYHNEKKEFEFDFEIGSGNKEDRAKINLQNNEAIVYCVSQFSPSNSEHFSVKMNEYANFKMELVDVEGFYLVKWFINNNLVKTLQTNVKSTIKFKAHCSLENLHFMGDFETTKENYVLFDFFKFDKF